MTEKAERTPRWVKAFGVAALVLLLVVVIVFVTGRGGRHGPGRHAPGSDTGGSHTGPPAGITHP